MALFRRNKTADAVTVPEEVNSYYQAENRERTWMAWLLALVTLAVTAIVIIGLFFGGRWVFRKFRHNSSPTTAVVTQNPAEKDKESPAANAPTSPQPTTPTPSQPSTNGSVNAPTNPAPSTSNPATPSSPAPTTPSQSPATANSNLPNTGPGDTLAVFAAVSVVAYFAHRKFLASRI